MLLSCCVMAKNWMFWLAQFTFFGPRPKLIMFLGFEERKHEALKNTWTIITMQKSAQMSVVCSMFQVI